MPDFTSISIVNILSLGILFSNFILLQDYIKDKKYKLTWLPISSTAILLIGILFTIGLCVAIYHFGVDAFILILALLSSAFIAILGTSQSALCLLTFLMIRPWEYFPEDHIIQQLPKYVAVYCLLTFCLNHWRYYRNKIVIDSATIIFLFFLLWHYFTGYLAINSIEVIDYFYKSMYPVAVLCFLLVHSITKESDYRSLKKVLLLILTTLIIHAWNYTLLDEYFNWREIRLESVSIWGNSNDLAALICLILPFTADLIYKNSPGKFLRYVLLTFILISLWLTQSRGAFLALIIGATVVFFISYDSKRWLKIIGLLALAPLIAFFLIFRSESDLADSSSARKNYLIAGVSMFSSSPIYGVGAGNYPNLYEYHTPEFYEWGQRNAHSTWIIPLAEGGLIGFLIFLFLYLDVLQRLLKIIKVDQGLTMSFIAYTVAMSFLSHTYSLLPYLIFSIVIIKFRLHQQVYS